MRYRFAQAIFTLSAIAMVAGTALGVVAALRSASGAPEIIKANTINIPMVPENVGTSNPFLLSAQLFPPVPDNSPSYAVFYEKVLSGAASSITLQLPAGTSRRTYLGEATVYSSVDTTFDIITGGTISTSTPGSPQPLNTASAGLTQVYLDSNVTGGAVIGRHTIKADSSPTIKFYAIRFRPSQPTIQRLSIRSSSITGTTRVTWIYLEGGV